MNDNLNETMLQNSLVFNAFHKLIFVLYKLKAWGILTFIKTVNINIQLLLFNKSVIMVCLIFFLFLKLSKLGHT